MTRHLSKRRVDAVVGEFAALIRLMRANDARSGMSDVTGDALDEMYNRNGISDHVDLATWSDDAIVELIRAVLTISPVDQAKRFAAAIERDAEAQRYFELHWHFVGDGGADEAQCPLCTPTQHGPASDLDVARADLATAKSALEDHLRWVETGRELRAADPSAFKRMLEVASLKAAELGASQEAA